jgi:hypothetical protein
VRTHKAALRLGPLVGEEHYLRFRLEDFCAAPGALLDQICEFLGVERVDLLARVNAETHHVIGNPMRLQPVRPIQPTRAGGLPSSHPSVSPWSAARAS